jgi:threonine synthase
LVKAAGSEAWWDRDDPILVLNTGSGLKDVKAAMQAVPEAPIIEPTLDAVRKVLG